MSTANMHTTHGTIARFGAGRQERIRNVLWRLDADVIALQEVCDLDFLHALGARLKMSVLPGEPTNVTRPVSHVRPVPLSFTWIRNEPEARWPCTVPCR